jgi:hypothetical protein
MDRLPGLKQVLTGVAIMAIVSALADAFWAAALPEHRTIYGLVHGAILLGAMGFVLARLVKSPRALLAGAGGLLVGVFCAALFYVLYALVGNAALLIAWMALWIAFAFLTGFSAPRSETASRTITRALAAAVLSGMAFWAVSGMWLGPHDPGPLYLRNLVYWAIAFLPGFAALMLWRPSD